jgi:hypothetical protein
MAFMMIRTSKTENRSAKIRVRRPRPHGRSTGEAAWRASRAQSRLGLSRLPRRVFMRHPFVDNRLLDEPDAQNHL